MILRVLAVLGLMAAFGPGRGCEWEMDGQHARAGTGSPAR